jgi:outer membrane protein assembly factor BamB
MKLLRVLSRNALIRKDVCMRLVVSSLILCAAASAASAADLPLGHKDFMPTPQRPVGWRGDGTGQYPGATPPIEWSETKNILWKTKMPEFSHSTPEEMEKVHILGFDYAAKAGYFVKTARTYSTPVPVGDRVFATVEPAALVCCDARTGKILWVRDHEPHKWPTKIRWHQDHEPVAKQWPKLYSFGYSTPTPVSDGQRVYVRFGNGVAAAYDMDGTLIWLTDVRLRIDPSRREYCVCIELLHQSPVLVRNKLIFFLDLGNRVLALDAATGKKAWELDVPVGPMYEMETAMRWAIWAGSPIVARIGDLETVVSSAGIMVTPDGRLLSSHIGIRSGCSSMLFSNDVLYATPGRTNVPSSAVRVTSSPTGVTSTPLWVIPRQKGGDIFWSPVLYEGMLVVRGESLGGELAVLDPATGEAIKRWDGFCETYSSPSVAGGYLFVPTQERGGLVAVYQGKDLKKVARNKIGEKNEGSCLAFQGDRIYFRGTEHLYCIGTK